MDVELVHNYWSRSDDRWEWLHYFPILCEFSIHYELCNTISLQQMGMTFRWGHEISAML
jgi:hypothetical protein